MIVPYPSIDAEIAETHTIDVDRLARAFDVAPVVAWRLKERRLRVLCGLWSEWPGQHHYSASNARPTGVIVGGLWHPF